MSTVSLGQDFQMVTLRGGWTGACEGQLIISFPQKQKQTKNCSASLMGMGWVSVSFFWPENVNKMHAPSSCGSSSLSGADKWLAKWLNGQWANVTANCSSSFYFLAVLALLESFWLWQEMCMWCGFGNVVGQVYRPYIDKKKGVILFLKFLIKCITKIQSCVGLVCG